MAGAFTWAPKESAVYLIRNTSNGKLYVGSTGNLRQRFRDHYRKLIGGRHHNKYLQAAWNKHSPEIFVFEVLELGLEDSSVVVREQFWIDSLKPEYNLSPTAGRVTGYRHTEAARAKFSKIHAGKIISDETRRRLSAALRGVKKTPKAIESMRHVSTGKRHTLETRQKMSLAKKGKPKSEHFKSVVSATLRKSICNRGLHELTEENISIRQRGNGNIKRLCRLCFNAKMRAKWKAKKDADPKSKNKRSAPSGDSV